MTRSFGLDAPSAFDALRSAVKRFKEDDLDEDLARDCACKAWHLCDHVFKALGSSPEFAGLRDLQDHVRAECPALAYLQDVCTASKHAEITLYQPSIDVAHVHVGDFSREDFCSNDFDTSRLELVLPQGETVAFNEVMDRAVAFWSQFLERHAIR